MSLDIQALTRITQSIRDSEPTDLQAGIDFAREAIEPALFDAQPMLVEEGEAVAAFVYALYDVADDLRQDYLKARGDQHRKVYWDLLEQTVGGLDDEPCPQPCPRCLREADARAGVVLDPVIA